MALAMPRPTARASTGVYHLNVRIPADLVDKVRATRVSLPFEGGNVTVVATDKVAFSLRTKDPLVAKARFIPAYAALARHFDVVRAGPKPITHKQIVALAGDVYQLRVRDYENDVALTPEWLSDELRQFDADIEAWRYDPTDGLGEISPENAEYLARLARPSGPQLLAFELNQDIDRYGVSMRLIDASEYLFGAQIDRVCADRGLMIDANCRRLLLRETAQAARLAAKKLLRNIEGDYSPDTAAARFPAFEASASAPAAKTVKSSHVETVSGLFERWKTLAVDKVTASTIRRYGPSVASLDQFANGRDWRLLTDEDVFAWAVQRRDADGIASATINRNDLVAVSSIFAWPMTMSGGKLSTSNPVLGIKLPLPKKVVTREKMFRTAEIKAILRLARDVKPDPRHPRASASRRWCPWLCAYSGARIQETLCLTKQHIRREGEVWVMDLQQTKDGYARSVPLHETLIEEGFLRFVEAAPPGFLFVGDREQKEGATRSAQELRAAELAPWVRSKVKLDPDLSPNHAWRHSWITYAEAAGGAKRFSNRITGHNSGKDASDGYVAGLVSMLAIEMSKFPSYNID